MKNRQNVIDGSFSEQENYFSHLKVITTIVLFVFIYVFYCEQVLAEQTVITGPQDNTRTETINLNETGDIEISGKIQIKELKFNKVGNTNVRFPGTQSRKLIDKSIRTNLPENIKAGVIYRNVVINFQILSAFTNITGLLNSQAAKAELSGKSSNIKQGI